MNQHTTRPPVPNQQSDTLEGRVTEAEEFKRFLEQLEERHTVCVERVRELKRAGRLV